MNIAFYETKDWEQAYLRQKLPGHNISFLQATDPGNSETEILSNFVGFPVTSEILKHFPKLKYITTRSTGYDHIDLKACLERGILVSNVPTYGENTVAEFAFALMLAVMRKLYLAIKRVREQAHFSTDGLEGSDLKGKTLGVIGTGHIGVNVIKIAKGFDMKVVAYDLHPNQELAKNFSFEYLSLDDLLKQADVVTLHAPYTPETHHLLNSEKFNLFKTGSILINTARGGLVETTALIQALKQGRLVGAGLDVLEEEGHIDEELQLLLEEHPNEKELKTLLADHELMRMDNVLITPHNASNSREAVTRILDTTVLNIEGFSSGAPVNVIK